MAVCPLVSHQDEGVDGKDSFTIRDSYGQQLTIEPLSRIWPSLKGAALPTLEALTLEQPASNKQSRQGYQDMAPWPKSGRGWGGRLQISNIFTMSPKGHFSCRQLRAETSWGPCISCRKFKVSSLQYCFPTCVTLRTDILQANLPLRELSMQHTEVLRTYRVKRRHTAVWEEKGRHNIPAGEAGGCYQLSKFDSVLSIHVVMSHPSL